MNGVEVETTVTVTLGGETRTVVARCVHPGGLDAASAIYVKGAAWMMPGGRNRARRSVTLELRRIPAGRTALASDVTDPAGRVWRPDLAPSIRGKFGQVIGWVDSAPPAAVVQEGIPRAWSAAWPRHSWEPVGDQHRRCRWCRMDRHLLELRGPAGELVGHFFRWTAVGGVVTESRGRARTPPCPGPERVTGGALT